MIWQAEPVSAAIDLKFIEVIINNFLIIEGVCAWILESFLIR